MAVKLVFVNVKGHGRLGCNVTEMVWKILVWSTLPAAVLAANGYKRKWQVS